jgi:23S rRNA (uracil1939-C5)-methyltransferase
MIETVVIDRLGHRGDGIAATSSGPLYVPLTLPGEQVAVERQGERGRLVEVLAASPDRVAPPCPHFGACGGCALQHFAEARYRAFKRDLVAAALADRRVNAPVADTVPAARPGGRRRVTLTARRGGSEIDLGYHARGSHEVVPIAVCPIADPAIVAALPSLRGLARRLLGERAPLRLTVTATAAGLDVAAHDARRLDDALRRRLVEETARLGLARLAVEGEVIVAARPPVVTIAGTAVVPPPGGFLQASPAAEAALTALVLGALGKARRVADLFAGVGTFSLAIARGAVVHAVEGDAGAVAALEAARKAASGLKPVTVERRDLFRRPLMAKELERFDAVVFDPPFAGAAAQAAELAAAMVKTVVAVSCNPATLARDLATLVGGGYTVESVTPVDQFLWSAHVEAVAVARR